MLVALVYKDSEFYLKCKISLKIDDKENIVFDNKKDRNTVIKILDTKDGVVESWTVRELHNLLLLNVDCISIINLLVTIDSVVIAPIGGISYGLTKVMMLNSISLAKTISTLDDLCFLSKLDTDNYLLTATKVSDARSNSYVFNLRCFNFFTDIDILRDKSFLVLSKDLRLFVFSYKYITHISLNVVTLNLVVFNRETIEYKGDIQVRMFESLDNVFNNMNRFVKLVSDSDILAIDTTIGDKKKLVNVGFKVKDLLYGKF